MHRFCKTLDGSKTGLTVLPKTLGQDITLYNKRPPVWKEKAEDRERFSFPNEKNLARGQELGPFIMDTIYHHAAEERNHQLQKIERIFYASWRHRVDEDLAEPWLHANRIAERWKGEIGSDRRHSDLAKIAEHVRCMYTKHRSHLNPQSPTKKASPKKEKAAFTELPIEVRQDIIRALSREFASMPLPSDLLMDKVDIDRVKASYAYVFDSEQKKVTGWTGFPWDVAIRELCAIKACASGPSKTVIGEFYEKFTMKRSSNVSPTDR